MKTPWIVSPPAHEPFRPTNLYEFCRQLQRAYAARCDRLGVRWSCDVPRQMTFHVPEVRLRQLVMQWINESLKMMPAGGELDVIVVRTAAGLEIEVADTRDAELVSEAAVGSFRRTAETEVADAGAIGELSCDVRRCPQGGIARTVFVPEISLDHTQPAKPTWRKVA